MSWFIELLKQSWFAVSPSPWSLAFYAIMGVIGGRQLLKQGAEYRRAPKLMAFLTAIFILGIVVFCQDSIWLIINTWRWIIPMYSDIASFWNYYVRFAENILGAVLMFLMSYYEWHTGMISVKNNTISCFAMIALMTFTVFSLAPNQAWTDWTFAVRYGFSDHIILESFLISHVGYKILIALAYLSLFQWKQRREKDLKKETKHNDKPHEAAL